MEPQAKRSRMGSGVLLLQPSELPITEVIARIEELNGDIARFWSSSAGWAPPRAAELLSRSRLDWQTSLSKSLHHWIVIPPSAITNGDLILAWVNLGSLIEGTIKTLLGVYYEDYLNDLSNLQQTQAWHHRKNKLLDPDCLSLNVLLDYCKKAKLMSDEEIELCELVQSRRNAVHAFQSREIGNGCEYQLAVRRYLALLQSVEARLPLPWD